MNIRTAKACEPCRHRKVKCNGESPCNNCGLNSVGCIYRRAIRNRRRTARPSPANTGHRDSPEQEFLTTTNAPDSSPQAPRNSELTRNEEVYHSVSATQAHAPSGHLQLFYGASSNFAFLQQIHRSLARGGKQNVAVPGEVQEGGEPLDMFVQRGLFFGTRSLADSHSFSTFDRNGLTLDMAMLFLDCFMVSSNCLLQFLNESDLRQSIKSICNGGDANKLDPQSRAIALIVLAVGAIGTEHLDLADVLFSKAKEINTLLDEAVNLQAVQLSLILAHYQLMMGRPNLGYLQLGIACRKSLAMGLHKDVCANKGTVSPETERRRATVWCVHFHECWLSLKLGRTKSMNSADMSCPYPRDQSFTTGLGRLAKIMEQSTEKVYGQKLGSLWDIYQAAKQIRADLQKFADDFELLAPPNNEHLGNKAYETILLSNFYYHTILLTFRPFLIAEAALRGKLKGPQVQSDSIPAISLSGDEMWLREASRHAIDAAQDQISFILSRTRSTPFCKNMRYNTFFIESCCCVLLYDSLWRRYAFDYNLQYINAGLHCLSEIITGEPTKTAKTSIERILNLVRHEISQQLLSTPTGNHRRSTNELSNSSTPIAAIREVSGLPDQHSIQAPTQASSNADQVTQMSEGIDAMYTDYNFPHMDLNFDIFTTDLYHFFPVDSMDGQNYLATAPYSSSRG